MKNFIIKMLIILTNKLIEIIHRKSVVRIYMSIHHTDLDTIPETFIRGTGTIESGDYIVAKSDGITLFPYNK